ncbi:MAG: aminopeptidase P N-terminal domain-containing protein [Myxococcota bacterium]|nr:aminopeptidase P N-terminal domain-containing protein [Myxococcota bacterium]
MNRTLYETNRKAFLEALGKDAAIVFSAEHHLRNGDAEYLYRQNSDFLYLSGWKDPDAVLLFRPQSEQPFVMFVQPKDRSKEIWTGRRPGPVGAVEDFGASAAYPISELRKRLPSLLQGFPRLHHCFAQNAENDKILMKALASARKLAKGNGMSYPEVFLDLSHTLHRLRLYKRPEEIEIMRKAAAITNEAHRAAMTITKPGVHEYELESIISHTFRKNGAVGTGYTSIVGGGENAVILHYIENDAVLEDDTLVCVDAGCEYQWYTADVTRTWPVNGTFNSAQKRLYEAVLKSQYAAIDAARVGNQFLDVHHAAIESLVESLIELGFLEGEVQEHVAEQSYRKWYMHGTSHWLGMDVHDVGPYAAMGESIALEPGMVLTIEPGLYVAGDDEDAPEEFRGMGIRIEDDILISADGPVNLTEAVPKTVADIEAHMGAAQ